MQESLKPNQSAPWTNVTQYSDITGLSQGSIIPDSSHIPDLSIIPEQSQVVPEQSGFDFKPLRESIGSDVSDISSTKQQPRLSGASDLSSSRLTQVSLGVSEISSTKNGRESIGSDISGLSGVKSGRASIESSASLMSHDTGKNSHHSSSKMEDMTTAIQEAGVSDYMSLEEREKLIGSEASSKTGRDISRPVIGQELGQEVELELQPDIRSLERPSIEGAAADDVTGSTSLPPMGASLADDVTGSSSLPPIGTSVTNRKISAGSKTSSHGDSSSFDWSKIDMFAPGVANKDLTSHQSSLSSTDWSKVDMFAGAEGSHRSSSSGRSSTDWGHVQLIPGMEQNSSGNIFK